MSNTRNTFSAEVRDRAVRMVDEHRADCSRCVRTPDRGAEVSTAATASFVLDALEQAIHALRPSAADGLIHHSDRVCNIWP
jgi:hypothetical protein